MSRSTGIVYDVACNFDPELIEVMCRHNEGGAFSAMLGGRPSSLGGGHRPSHGSKGPIDELASYVRLCHSRGLKFNHLMDRTCASNREVFPDDHQTILKSVDEIVACGVDGVTVNSPLLCAVIRRRHPHLEIRVGAQSSISTCKHVLQWKEAGADTLTLGGRLTRDFYSLRAVLRLAKRLGVKVRMVANSACLRDCAYMNSHTSALAHSGHSRQQGCGLFLDYNLLQCTYDKLSSPATLMASSWVRPEDVARYHDLCEEVELDEFGFVLLDGWKPTAFLARVISAYARRSFDGNLLDILCLPEGGWWRYPIEQEGPASGRAFCGTDLARLKRFFQLPQVYVDNKRLDGFIDPFLQGLRCEDMICAGGQVCDPIEGLVCDHCATWAETAISADGAECTRWKADAEGLLESIRTSRVFGGTC